MIEDNIIENYIDHKIIEDSKDYQILDFEFNDSKNKIPINLYIFKHNENFGLYFNEPISGLCFKCSINNLDISSDDILDTLFELFESKFNQSIQNKINIKKQLLKILKSLLDNKVYYYDITKLYNSII